MLLLGWIVKGGYLSRGTVHTRVHTVYSAATSFVGVGALASRAWF